MLNLLRKIVPQFLINWYHFFLSFAGAFFYGFPSRKLIVIGITGTNGKSTVVDLITKILEETSEKVCSLSSIRFKIGSEEQINDLKMTMPGRFRIQKFLRKAVDSDCRYAVLEITSEGIKQYRHRFIDFEVALLTNLTPEHIEAHGSFEKYREAKGKLFEATKKIHILNVDDENSQYFWQFPSELKIGYGLNLNQELEVSEILKGENPIASEKGVEFKIENQNFRINLLGFFNIYNCLAAISIAKSQKIPLEICKRSLEKVKGIPGRMEEVISRPFKVFVDYAFTPNALEKVYQTIRNNFKPRKLICVLGAAGGGRDKWKRPILGKLAAKYCDEIFVTNEDPYDEDPMEIINQVASGAEDKTQKILDRREAIKKAVSLAEQGDTVIITGKGCETSIAEKGKKIPWDDRKVVREEFSRLANIHEFEH
jgi:UDP-N-acetylmuramoyl-L-alanyl-D-glutamate--2,6-diaminopimelate ligase